MYLRKYREKLFFYDMNIEKKDVWREVSWNTCVSVITDSLILKF